MTVTQATAPAATAPAFVHLHCHSHYSLLDGAGRIGELVGLAKGFGMEALALTDHGNMFGALEFYHEARKQGVKPIVGYEAYVAPGSRRDTSTSQRANGYYHQTLLATNRRGYLNLVKLASMAYTEGFYRKPRIDFEALRAHSEGVICLSGCLRSEICYALAHDEPELAHAALDRYLEVFGDRFYVELQYNGIEQQRTVSLALAEIAAKKGLPMVLTNDVHYPTRASARMHDVLLCIQTQRTLTDPSRFKFETDEFYLKGPAEMATVFPQFPEALANTVAIARRCDLEIETGKRHLPAFVPPRPGLTVEQYFRELCLEGLVRRYGDPVPAHVLERFEVELAVIVKMGFPTYFLIVADFIAYARGRGISVGPGRGSAAGSIIAYALAITNIDPLPYDLLFERFLNEGRNELPDIDIDFDAERRAEVIDYVVERYGRANVCQVVTFSKLQAKAAIRDVARVLGHPLALADRLAKLVPDGPGVSISGVLAAEQDLSAAYAADPKVAEILDLAKQVEGLVRNTGVHAAAVIIADADVSDYCPLAASKDGVTTQYPMEQCEQVGLLKMDFLGLKNLTIIEETLDLIEVATGKRPVPDRFPLDDPATYALLGKGDTKGIFQLEGTGMRDILVKFKPDCFGDVIAIVAIYRPGPLGSGMVEDFIERKHGRAKVEYAHPLLADVLKDTYGVMVYQEQVMRIANVMGGFSLSDADKLRKAMGKKKADIMEKYKSQFVTGAMAKGIDRALAGETFDLMAKFAGYGFNKSHSAAYALVSYQTAYLKAHHRIEFTAALASSNADDTDKLGSYLEECKQEGIAVLPPDVNASRVRFSVDAGRIRFGLGAVKRCGEKALASIMDARREGGPFKDLFDLCQRIDGHVVNKAVLEALVKSGATDSLGGHRAQQLAALESFVRTGGAFAAGRKADQLGLFDDLAEEELPKATMPDVPRWSDHDLLQHEKDVMGFFLSGHPLTQHKALIATFGTATTRSLAQHEAGQVVRLGGLVSQARVTFVKSGKNQGRKMLRFTLEDLEGSCPALCFSDTFEALGDLLVLNQQVFVTGEVDKSGPDVGLKVTNAIPLAEVGASFTTSVLVRVDPARHPKAALVELKELLRTHRGEVPVFLEVVRNGERVFLSTGKDCAVAPSSQLADALTRLVGFGGHHFKTSTARAGGRG